MSRNEIRLMEAAVALAEELNFSRAAQRLRISQPALTKQIAEVESRFALVLFNRDSQTVSLTEVGRAYVEEARLALLHSERAIQVARSVLAQAETILRVGRSPFADPFLVSTLQSVRLPLFPRLKLDVISSYSLDLVHDLIAGRVELALVTDPPETATLTTLMIAEEPLFVVMTEENALADKPELNLHDLDGANWALLRRTVQPIAFDRLMSAANEEGVHSSDLYQVLTPEEAHPYLFDNAGLGIFTRSAALRIARDGATIRPLAVPGLVSKTYLASRTDDATKLTSEMVRAFSRKLRSIEGNKQMSLQL